MMVTWLVWPQSLIKFSFPSYASASIEVIYVWCTDESDEEDEARPSRRRRLGERAAEGADDDEEVC